VPDAEQESAAYQRSPVDALHLAVAAAGFLLCLVLAVGAKNTMVGVEADLLQLVDRVPSALAVFLVGLVQLVAVMAPPVVLAVTLVLRGSAWPCCWSPSPWPRPCWRWWSRRDSAGSSRPCWSGP
jgi:hypothetical protein